LPIIFGCQNDNLVTNPDKSSDLLLLPLNVGNTWVYSNSKRVYNDTIYLSETTKLNGETVYTINNNAFFYKDGALYTFLVNNPSTTPQVIIPKNPVLGQTWYVYGNKWKLVEKNVSIRVPAGTFSCYLTHITGENEYNVYWANGKGFIMVDDISNKIRYQLEYIKLY